MRAIFTTPFPTFISTDTQFRMSILERLEQMEQRMAEITNQNSSSETVVPKGSGVEGGAAEQQSQVIKKKYFYIMKFSFWGCMNGVMFI